MVDVSVKGRRHTATCETSEAAKRAEAEIRHDLSFGLFLSNSCWTLDEAWERCYEVVWRGTPSDEAQVALRVHLYAQWPADTPLKAITTDELDDWVRALRSKGNSGATINRKLAALSKVMRVAAARPERSGYTVRPTFTWQKEAEGRIREVSGGEEKTLLGHLPDDHCDVVTVLIDTGMRCSELWRVEVRDIDLQYGLIHIWKTKTEYPRAIPMTRRVRAIIERRRQPADGRLFPYSNAWLRGEWQRARFLMALDKDPLFVPHILRHTCACRLVQRGVGIEVVRDWLGHKTIAMTLRYARLTPKNLLDAVQVLENPGE